MLMFPVSLAAQDFFERYYDSGGDEVGFALILTGSNLLLAGWTDANAPDRNNGVLHALDLNGDLRATATIAGPRRSRILALTNTETVAGPGVIAGAWINVSETSDNQMFYTLNVARIANAFGWGDAVDDEQVNNLITLSNGDVLAMGNIGNTPDGLLTRLSPAGTLRWQRTFTIPGTRFNVFQQAREVSDGIVLVGYSTVEEVTGATILVKISQQGDLLWSYRYSYPNELDARFRTLQLLPNGDFIITSQVVTNAGTADILFLRLDREGELLEKWLLGGLGPDRVQATLLSPNGTLWLAGVTSSTEAGAPTALVMETTFSGEILRQRTLANFGGSRINALVPAPQGGLFLGGSGQYCREDQQDMLLVYLNDTLGNPLESCYSLPVNLTRRPAANIVREANGRMADREAQSITPFPVAERPVTINDKNCPFLDLDVDNSSGSPGPYWFQLPDTCYTGPLPILDTDAAFTFSTPVIDSCWLRLFPVNTGEYLDFPPEIAGNFVRRGTNHWTLLNTSNYTSNEVVDLLQLVRYRNDNTIISAGRREIRYNLFFPCSTGNVTSTHFTLPASGPFAPDLPDAVICPNETLVLDASVPGATAYVWGDGAQDASRRITEPGEYLVTISNQCSSTPDTVLVTRSEQLGQLPSLQDQALCPGDSLLLDVATTGAFSYQWSDGSSRPRRALRQPGAYGLTISNGCQDETFAFQLTNQSCCRLYFPSAFSPNGDGINDDFRAFPDPDLCAQITDYQLRIFNRWGGEVYAGQSLTEGWDGSVTGRLVTTGHYVYVITYHDGFQAVQRQGGFVLLR